MTPNNDYLIFYFFFYFALDACDLQLSLVKLADSETAEDLDIATIDD